MNQETNQQNNKGQQNSEVTKSKNMNSGIIITAVVVIVIIIVASLFSSMNKGSTSASDMNASDTSATSSGDVTINSAGTYVAIPQSISGGNGAIVGIPLTQVPFIYVASTDQKSYRQGQTVNIAITVVNNTSVLKTFSFTNGCQGDFIVDGFEMVAHTRCLPTPSSFAVQPHNEATVPLVLLPAVFQLPPGTYPVYASIVGYGGATTTITITK